MSETIKNSVFEFNVIGDRGIHSTPDFMIGVDENEKVAMKLGDKIFNEDDIGQGGGKEYTIEILDPDVQ